MWSRGSRHNTGMQHRLVSRPEDLDARGRGKHDGLAALSFKAALAIRLVGPAVQVPLPDQPRRRRLARKRDERPFRQMIDAVLVAISSFSRFPTAS